MTKIVGIVNLTRDSFSDGGRFLSSEAAVAHVRGLVADGADVVDLGAESTHPDSEDVCAEEEIARLRTKLTQKNEVISELMEENVRAKKEAGEL